MNTLFKTVALSILFAGTTATSTAQITPGSPDNFVVIINTLNRNNIIISTFLSGEVGDIYETYLSDPTILPGYNFGHSAITYSVNYSVYWEQVDNPSVNGTCLNITNNNGFGNVDAGECKIANLSPNTDYRIEITGQYPLFRLGHERGGIKEVKQWGKIEWRSCHRMFIYVSSNFQITATDTPNFSKVKTMQEMFYSLNSAEGLDQSKFNSDISNWDVSNVQNMENMFFGCANFNQDISSWNVGNVVNMKGMFMRAKRFNQAIGSWNTSKVICMANMFRDAYKFNQNINTWDVSSVKRMDFMFHNATDFNQPLGNWDVSNVLSMTGMFWGDRYNNLFTVFNQNIGSWNTGKVVNMSNMFNSAIKFNQDISSWNTENVRDMSAMFSNARSFNQNIGAFNLKNVRTLDLRLNNYRGMGNIFDDSGITCENYSNTLIGWANNPNTPDSVALGYLSWWFRNAPSGPGSIVYRTYSNDATTVTARNTLSQKKWTFIYDKKSDVPGCPQENIPPVDKYENYGNSSGGNPPDGSKNAINELNIEQVTIFPNPSAEMLTLNGLQGSTKLIITDINGKTVFSTETENETEILPISNLVSGMYLLHVHSENVQGTKKFVKE